MSEKREWDVIREHEGARFYRPGDIRVGTREDIGHLAPHCLRLRTDTDEGKAETDLLNKAEVAPANKAATRRKAK